MSAEATAVGVTVVLRVAPSCVSKETCIATSERVSVATFTGLISLVPCKLSPETFKNFQITVFSCSSHGAVYRHITMEAPI